MEIKRGNRRETSRNQCTYHSLSGRGIAPLHSRHHTHLGKILRGFGTVGLVSHTARLGPRGALTHVGCFFFWKKMHKFCSYPCIMLIFRPPAAHAPLTFPTVYCQPYIFRTHPFSAKSRLSFATIGYAFSAKRSPIGWWSTFATNWLIVAQREAVFCPNTGGKSNNNASLPMRLCEAWTDLYSSGAAQLMHGGRFRMKSNEKCEKCTIAR